MHTYWLNLWSFIRCLYLIPRACLQLLLLFLEHLFPLAKLCAITPLWLVNTQTDHWALKQSILYASVSDPKATWSQGFWKADLAVQNHPSKWLPDQDCLWCHWDGVLWTHASFKQDSWDTGKRPVKSKGEAGYLYGQSADCALHTSMDICVAPELLSGATWCWRMRRRKGTRNISQKDSGQLPQHRALHLMSFSLGQQQPSRANVRAVGIFCTIQGSLHPLLWPYWCLAMDQQAGEMKASPSVSTCLCWSSQTMENI